MRFFWQGRLGEKPSDRRKHYYPETMREPAFLEALHQWDKAQVAVLGEQGVAPPEAIAGLVQAIAAMESEGVVQARSQLWNVIHGGDEYVRKHITAARTQLEDDRGQVTLAAQRIEAARKRLDHAFARLRAANT